LDAPIERCTSAAARFAHAPGASPGDREVLCPSTLSQQNRFHYAAAIDYSRWLYGVQSGVLRQISSNRAAAVSLALI
jgi:hypothetical protein